MRNFFAFSLLLISSLSFAGPIAGSSGSVPTLTIGGRVFTDLSNLIILRSVDGGVTNETCTLRKSTASAGYQVTSGKTLKLMAVRCISQNSTAHLSYAGYGDTDVGFNAGTSNPTNTVWMEGSQSGFYTTPASQAGVTELAIDFQIPSQKYPFVKSGDTGLGLCTWYGYEQ